LCRRQNFERLTTNDEFSTYCARPANGSKAMFRACLMARDKRR
jgi:hypothetical protein